jgi:hypothetical protein
VSDEWRNATGSFKCRLASFPADSSGGEGVGSFRHPDPTLFKLEWLTSPEQKKPIARRIAAEWLDGDR